MPKFFSWCLFGGIILNVIAIVLGGFLIKNYSHINQVVSEIAILLDKDDQLGIAILFGLYNVLTLIYGVGNYLFLKDNGIIYKIQSQLIIIISILGLLLLFFPMNMMGEEVTVAGIIHISLAGIMGPLSSLCCLLGFWIFKDSKKMRLFSLIVCTITFVYGIITIFFIAFK
jgi:hypothetical protein